jgi:GT2 family glycosyltransferase
MNTSTPKTAVIICAYTEARWDDLCEAVASVQQQTSPPSEIIVVVDHNPALLKRAQAQWPALIVVENHEARGLSGARNSGIAAAQGDIIVFLDDDAVAEPNWLAQITEGYRDPKVMGVGGAIEPLWLGGRPRWFPAEFQWVVGCTYRGMPETPAPIRNLIGCNMSLRRAVFEAVGGFRVGIGRVGTWPVGCEETELCIRAKQHWPQCTVLYLPQMKVQHRVPANRGTGRYFVSRCFAEGISKALVAQAVGSKDGLASERAYTLQTLPQGVWHGLRDAVLQFDVAGLGRALAIVMGLAITAVGYLYGTLAERKTTKLHIAAVTQGSE